jgi:hypothetical protein
MKWTIGEVYGRRTSNITGLGDVRYLKKEFIDWVRSIEFEEFLKWGYDEWTRTWDEEAEEYYEKVLADTGDKEHAEKMKETCYKSQWLYLQEEMLEFLLSGDGDSFRFAEMKAKDQILSRMYKNLGLNPAVIDEKMENELLSTRYVFQTAYDVSQNESRRKRLLEFGAPEEVISESCPKTEMGVLKASQNTLNRVRKYLEFVSNEEVRKTVNDWLGTKEDIYVRQRRMPGAGFSRQ